MTYKRIAKKLNRTSGQDKNVPDSMVIRHLPPSIKYAADGKHPDRKVLWVFKLIRFDRL